MELKDGSGRQFEPSSSRTKTARAANYNHSPGGSPKRNALRVC